MLALVSFHYCINYFARYLQVLFSKRYDDCFFIHI